MYLPSICGIRQLGKQQIVQVNTLQEVRFLLESQSDHLNAEPTPVAAAAEKGVGIA